MVIGLPLATVMGFRQEGTAPPPSSSPAVQPAQDEAFGEELRSMMSDPSARATRQGRAGATAPSERQDPGASAGLRQSPATAPAPAVRQADARSVDLGGAGTLRQSSPAAAKVETGGRGPLPRLNYPAPPVPVGVVNASNLYNDVYGDLPPLAWDDPEFQSRLSWVQSQVPFTITSWSSTVNPSPFSAPIRTSTMFHAQVGSGAGFDFDVRSLMQNPDLVAYRLKTLQNPDFKPPLTPFPGRLAVQPPTASPVGTRWVDPSFGGRTMFHAGAETSYAPGDIFETPEGRYQKVQFVVQSAAGPAGSGGGEVVEGWELVYRR